MDSPDLPPALALDAVDVPSMSDPDRVALRGVTWSVGAGESWLVVGGPGSGKTGLLQVAAGLVRPLRGRHLLFGGELASMTESERVVRRAKVGVVFGGGGRLFGNLTVAENLLLPLRYHAGSVVGDLVGRVGAVLDLLGLTPVAGRWPRELPQRIAQRVALARALVLEPEVLVLDDPLEGLPTEDAEWWIETIHARIEGGKGAHAPRTIVVAAVEPGPWRRLAARFAAVGDGQWRIAGSAEEAGRWLRPAAGG